MANSVATQLDIGGLTLHGLSSFSKMLATFSSDDVTPTAMIRMEHLGSVFLISGKHADRVPDLLQRYSSVRLDRTLISVGWRKGDSASIMAQSAGGQAIALLSLVLGSVYDGNDLGSILKGLSQRLISENVIIASVSQFARVAPILRNKLAPLGYGNRMAEQVVWIYKMYEMMGKPTPSNLLQKVNAEAMVDILERTSNALREAHYTVRFRGSYGAGYMLSLILIIFPHDTLVTLDGIVVDEGTRHPSSIIFELGRTDDGSIGTGQLEVHPEHKNGLRLPIKIQQKSQLAPHIQSRSFEWHYWVRDLLTLEFARVGIKDTQKILQAGCNFLLAFLVDPS